MSICKWMHSHCAFFKNGFWNGTPKSIHNSFSDISFVSFFLWSIHPETAAALETGDEASRRPFSVPSSLGPRENATVNRGPTWIVMDYDFAIIAIKMMDPTWRFKTSVMAGNNTDQGRPKLLWEIIGWQAPWTRTSTAWLARHQRIRFANCSYSLWLMLEAQIVGNTARLCKNPLNRYRTFSVHSIPK